MTRKNRLHPSPFTLAMACLTCLGLFLALSALPAWAEGSLPDASAAASEVGKPADGATAKVNVVIPLHSDGNVVSENTVSPAETLPKQGAPELDSKTSEVKPEGTTTEETKSEVEPVEAAREESAGAGAKEAGT